jgi:hypothetical protein
MKRLKLLALMTLLGLVSTGFGDAPANPSDPITADQQPNDVVHYSGDIGGRLQIGLQLRFDKGGATADGCYFYYKYCKDIRIDAKVVGRGIVIHEFDPAGAITGQFVGRFEQRDPRHQYSSDEDLKSEVIAGEWSRPDGSGRRPFYLIEDFSGPIDKGAGSYQVAGFDDSKAVDQVATRFLKAVVEDSDREAVAGCVRFPITVTLDGRRQSLNSQAKLLANYSKIFTPGFVQRLRFCAPVHLFARDQGVMIGDGDIWFGPVTVAGKTDVKVIAINDGLEDGPPARNFFGDWQITRVAGYAHVYAMDDETAKTYLGTRVSFSNDAASFRGPDGKVDQCKSPAYHVTTSGREHFAAEERVDPADLGLTSPEISSFEVTEKNGRRWVSIGGSFEVKSYGSIIVQWDGVYFEMNRADPVPAARGKYGPARSDRSDPRLGHGCGDPAP